MDGWAEDVTLVTHGDLAGLVGVTGHNVLAGKEAVRDWFADWFRQFARDYRFEIDQVHDLGDRVLIVAIHHARGRTSGVPVTIRSGYLYTAREGKVSQMELWDNSEDALEATGLPE
jgi:ketosteroid isomerase-like protein